MHNMTSPWTDIGATTAEPMSIRKPINIHRTMLNAPRHVMPEDVFRVAFQQRFEDGTLISEQWSPSFNIDREMTIDSITRFEVIDEFGVDVGIGFVLGQRKR